MGQQKRGKTLAAVIETMRGVEYVEDLSKRKAIVYFRDDHYSQHRVLVSVLDLEP